MGKTPLYKAFGPEIFAASCPRFRNFAVSGISGFPERLKCMALMCTHMGQQIPVPARTLREITAVSDLAIQKHRRKNHSASERAVIDAREAAKDALHGAKDSQFVSIDGYHLSTLTTDTREHIYDAHHAEVARTFLEQYDVW